MDSTEKIKKNYKLMGTESDPVIIAQRLLNLYRQLHIFSPEKKEAYNQMLIEQPQSIKRILSTLPGGIVLQQYLAELEGEDEGDFEKPVNNKEERDIEQSVRPTTFDAQPTVVSVANDPQMIKGIVDAFKEAIITSEKHRKEDTKELAQTIVALQSKVMQDMMNKMSNQSTASASRVETKVTTVETKVMNAEATNNQSGFQLSQLEDVVAGISKAQGELIKDMAQSQTEQLSQLISKVLKEIQQMSTQTLIDAVQAVHRENMDFFKNQIFSSVSKMPMNAEIIEPEVKSEQVKKSSQKIKEDKTEQTKEKQDDKLEEPKSDKKAKGEELIIEKNKIEDTKKEELEVTKNVEEEKRKEQALYELHTEEKQDEVIQPEKTEPEEIQVENKQPENNKKEIDNAETKIDDPFLDEEVSNAISLVPEVNTEIQEEIKEEIKEEAKAENTIANVIQNDIEDNNKKHKKFTFPWEILGKKVDEIKKDHDFVTRKDFSSVQMDSINHNQDSAEHSQALQIQSKDNMVSNQKNIAETKPYHMEAIPHDGDNIEYTPVALSSLTEEDMVDLDSFSDKEFTNEENITTQSEEEYEWDYVEDNSEEDVITANSTPEENESLSSVAEHNLKTEDEYEWDYIEDGTDESEFTENVPQEDGENSPLEADHIQTIEEEYEWDYIEDGTDESEFTENLAQENGENSQQEVEHIQKMEEEYEWDYVEEESNEHILEENSEEMSEDEYEWDYVEEESDEHILEENSEEISEDEYEWDYVEEESTDKTLESDEDELDEEYEWDYIEDTEAQEIGNDEQNQQYVKTVVNEKKKEKDPYNPRQQNETHTNVSNPLLAENSFVFSEFEEDRGKIILDDNFGLSSSEESPK